MKHLKTLSAFLLSAALVAPALVMAQDNKDDHRDPHQAAPHEMAPHEMAPHEAAPKRAEPARGAGPNHSWHNGDRIPASYRGKKYEVSDWQSHHLTAPPSGYHWVQVNGDFVLAAVATGVIADLLLGN